MKPQLESNINKKPLYWLAALLLMAYTIIVTVVYQQVKNTVIENKLDELNQHILYQKSLRQYINTQLKPVIYNLQKQQIISYDYFDPHLLSATFIARNIYQNFDESLDAKNMHSWKYRLAAKNPLNPINQATPAEIELLNKFNNNHNLKSIYQIETINGEETLYYAAPFNPNNASCLRCHGIPKVAPKGLIERYGSETGFYEKIGDIRAFFSYRLKLSESMAYAHKPFIAISIIIFAFIMIFYAITAWAYLVEQKRKLLVARQQEELEFVAHHDFLTKLKNRHCLSRDFSAQLTEINKATHHYSNLWVIMLDIDFFKAINDDFGHDIGDIALKKFGEILQEEVKNLEHAEAYRLGGEEFLIIIRNTDAKIINALYTDICESFANIEIQGLDRTIQLSAGATEVQLEEHQFDILKRVDKALYQAKEQGRNRLIII
ncbi:diguanylate cyclase domain-containing protein [Thiomicrorhabdus lithotrophica]|uniref:diguanylate cyclase n=1 Tax=Thiomicrorhabdus lithotrophica TaxID=2949997 RepID=A0ABY8C917_9GAMM|nr:diguanylate cyclase [Thiomicrorhabdus lithotrophica]WEJ62465.1 diguanylate cyclase [Thiomicrorhabdus lithotrophica]